MGICTTWRSTNSFSTRHLRKSNCTTTVLAQPLQTSGVVPVLNLTVNGPMAQSIRPLPSTVTVTILRRIINTNNRCRNRPMRSSSKSNLEPCFKGCSPPHPPSRSHVQPGCFLKELFMSLCPHHLDMHTPNIVLRQL